MKETMIGIYLFLAQPSTFRHSQPGLSIDPTYISEIAPPSHRGHLVSFSEIAINFGIMLGPCDPSD